MNRVLTQVEQWRAMADELFARADMVRNQVARDHMLDMAEGYMRLANEMEDLAAKQLAEREKRKATKGEDL